MQNKNNEQILLDSIREISIANKSLSVSLEKALKTAEKNQNSYHELETIAIKILESMNGEEKDWTEQQTELYSCLENALKSHC